MNESQFFYDCLELELHGQVENLDETYLIKKDRHIQAWETYSFTPSKIDIHVNRLKDIIKFRVTPTYYLYRHNFGSSEQILHEVLDDLGTKIKLDLFNTSVCSLEYSAIAIISMKPKRFFNACLSKQDDTYKSSWENGISFESKGSKLKIYNAIKRTEQHKPDISIINEIKRIIKDRSKDSSLYKIELRKMYKKNKKTNRPLVIELFDQSFKKCLKNEFFNFLETKIDMPIISIKIANEANRKKKADEALNYMKSFFYITTTNPEIDILKLNYNMIPPDLERRTKSHLKKRITQTYNFCKENYRFESIYNSIEWLDTSGLNIYINSR